MAAQDSAPPRRPDPASLLDLGRSVIRIEAQAVARLEERLDDRFVQACELLIACRGRIVVCGIGKSGHIGAKLAATFASTGSPAFFVHAAEASHGDLGMLRDDDVLVALSYSGSSSELLTLIPGIRQMGVPLISLCGEPESPLARASTVVLDTRVEREACPLGLAPTASTTAALAFGDALAIALLGERGFTEQDFARSHPGGRLGRRLLLRVSDVMVGRDVSPSIRQGETLMTALMEISSRGLGMVTVLDELDRLCGIFTDGDLRRALERGVDIHSASIGTVMTADPATISDTSLAVDAVALMQRLRITSLPVVDGRRLQGVVTMHALLAAGVV
ncbi:KpsF/GutQ family sugar-phosphate isomerase [Granulosicoccus sp. 3-233]|uniref:KpsF/GutQ family sugar-phosphate isomerase n=1 Tax=Granulosicoccus sp. 3-233 TaxID=3417969 RepID=UPI003D3531CF